MNKYLIIQNSRKDSSTHLALIDRTITKEAWWTNNFDLAIKFISKEKANEVVSKYKYNNARVVPYDEAKKIIKPTVIIFRHKRRTKNIFEMSDYDYKEWLGYSDALEYGGGMFE